MSGSVVVLAGGTGGAKFVRGVACCVPPEQLTVIVNTADDVTMHGLRISPDVDIILYTLAGLVDPVKAWGFAGDTFNCLAQLQKYGREGWFQLGDRDLATHLHRTRLLAQGKPPSQVVNDIRRALGLRQRVLPMTDQEVETHIQLRDGSLLHFQEYLIREGAPVDVQAVVFQNVGSALPAKGVLHAIEGADVLLIAPSSPVVSIGTILSVNGIFDAIAASGARRAAVSPLLGGAPIAGPSEQLMRAYGIDVSNTGLAEAYDSLIELLVIHERDIADVPALEWRRLRTLAIDTLMPTIEESTRVARSVLEALDYAVVDVPAPEPPPFVASVPGPSPHSIVRNDANAAEVRALHDRVAELEAALANAEEATVAWAEVDALQDRLRAVEQALADARAVAARREGDSPPNDAPDLVIVADLQDEVHTKVVALAASEAALAEAEQQLTDVAARLHPAEEERHRTAEALANAERLIADLTERLRTVEGEREHMVEGLAAAEQAAQETRGAVERVDAQWADAFRSLELEGEERAACLEREAAVLGGVRDEARDRSEALEQQLAEQITVVQRLEAEHAAPADAPEQDSAPSAAPVAEDEVLAPSPQLEAQQAEWLRTETAHTARIQELEQAVDKAAERRRKTREHRLAQWEQARAIVERLRAQAAKAQQLTEKAERRAEEADRAVDAERSATADLQARAESLAAELAAANAAVTASEARVTQLQEQLDDLTATDPAEIHPLAPTIAAPPAKAAAPVVPAFEFLEQVDTPPAEAPPAEAPTPNAPMDVETWAPVVETETLADRARRRGHRSRAH